MSAKPKADEIPEVTPEMIEAGISAYYDLDHYPDDYGISETDVAAIYRAMKEAASRRSIPSPSATGKSESNASERR